jgi:hypothetical protein
MPCECLCAYDSRFVLHFIVILLYSPDGCNGCRNCFFIRNNSRNPFRCSLVIRSTGWSQNLKVFIVVRELYTHSKRGPKSIVVA